MYDLGKFIIEQTIMSDYTRELWVINYRLAIV